MVTTTARPDRSFWLVDALDDTGRHHDAVELFDRLCDLAGPPGLFAEMLDPHSGTHVGNYPQGFTHIGLLDAGLRLGRQAARQALPVGPPRHGPATTGGSRRCR